MADISKIALANGDEYNFKDAKAREDLEGIDIVALKEVSPSQKPYNVGDHLTYNGVIYDVIRDISIGDTLTVGTNISTSDLSELEGLRVYWEDNTEYSENMITVDTELSTTSTNPVQNKIITNAINNIQNTLVIDSTPTSGSTNLVSSGGVYSYIDTMITQALSGSY